MRSARILGHNARYGNVRSLKVGILILSIQATTGYNESENAAGAVAPWTIEEPGSYQLPGRIRGHNTRYGNVRGLRQEKGTSLILTC